MAFGGAAAGAAPPEAGRPAAAAAGPSGPGMGTRLRLLPPFVGEPKAVGVRMGMARVWSEFGVSRRTTVKGRSGRLQGRRRGRAAAGHRHRAAPPVPQQRLCHAAPDPHT